MSSPQRTATARLRADPRLTAYLLAGFGALIVAIVAGQPALAALGAPFLALAAIGLSRGTVTEVAGEVMLAAGRVIEGDSIEGSAHVEWQGIAEVDAVLSSLRGVRPVEPAAAIGWSLAPGRGPVTLPFQLRARSWGLHQPGALWVRMRRPGGLLIREQKLATAPTLRVLPAPLRLARLLKPAEPHAIAGMHSSRLRGHGTDFAELRPYQPGDRLRDVSWSTSARLGKPWVAVHHPERTGTVLLVVDAFTAADATGREALARAARAAWAVASGHLQAQDRVGLLVKGHSIAWLPPGGGRRARWMLLDELLAVGGAAEEGWQTRRRTARTVVPSDALIVGVTSLGWPSFTRELLHNRRIGHTTVALVIDLADLLPRAGGPLDEAAQRIWFARRDSERRRLEGGGVPTAMVTTANGAAAAISALRRRMSRQRRPNSVAVRAQ